MKTKKRASDRTLYDPEIHFAHRTPFTREELEYLCAFYEHDGARMMAYALGRTESSLAAMFIKLRNRGDAERYRKAYWKHIETYEEEPTHENH